MRYGKPKYWFDAKIGIRIERGEEEDTSPCLTATANYSSDLVEAKAGVAEESSQAGCPDRTYDAQSHLCFDDIQVDNRASPTLIQVQIKASKTDPFRHGVTLHMGATNGPLCPVAAVLSYMVARGSAAAHFLHGQMGVT